MPLIARAITLEEQKSFVHSSDPAGLALIASPVTIEKPDTSGSTRSQTTTRAYYDSARDSAYTEKEMLAYIQSEESGGNPNAQNPRSSAYGLYGFLDSTWASVGCIKTLDPIEQERCAILYMKQRYGGIEGAYNFHRQNNYY